MHANHLVCGSLQDKLSSGFDKCMEAKTCALAQAQLDGKFFHWSGRAQLFSNRTRGATLRTDVTCSEFEVELNVTFAVCTLPEEAVWIPWFSVKHLTLPGAGYGLFANQCFKCGDTIGIYMGAPPPPPTVPA